MAAQEKTYYPWELWNSATKARGMHFVTAKFSRIELDCICSAVVSAPAVCTEIIEGVPRKLLHWSDIYYRSNGMAYDKAGHRKQEFDLNLSSYGK